MQYQTLLCSILAFLFFEQTLADVVFESLSEFTNATTTSSLDVSEPTETLAEISLSIPLAHATATALLPGKASSPSNSQQVASTQGTTQPVAVPSVRASATSAGPAAAAPTAQGGANSQTAGADVSSLVNMWVITGLLAAGCLMNFVL